MLNLEHSQRLHRGNTDVLVWFSGCPASQAAWVVHRLSNCAVVCHLVCPADELKEKQAEAREAQKEAREVARENQAVLRQVSQAESAIAAAEREVEQVRHI